jgi:predicted nucleic acid-binding protein
VWSDIGELSFGVGRLGAAPWIVRDAGVARAYGRIYASVLTAGRKARARRAVDLLIAATALAHDLPLHTQNPDDFVHLEGLHVVSVAPA